MLYGTIITIHIIVCVFLIIVVLIQAGRGGGLAESFTGAESIFGTKTNAFLTRATTFFAVLFFITCLSLAILAKQRSTSLIKGRLPQSAPAPKETIPEKEKQPVPTEQPQTQPAPPQAKEDATEANPQTQEKSADPQPQQQSQKSQ